MTSQRFWKGHDWRKIEQRAAQQIAQVALDSTAIIQFSSPRTGSTLIFNVLRLTFPARPVVKTHNYQDWYSGYPVVTTYRHPLDCLASSIQRYGRTPTDAEIERQIIELERYGIWDVLRIRDYPNVLSLRYESFFGNLDFVFDQIEAFFHCNINSEARSRIATQVDIRTIKALVDRKSSFAEYDPLTHWHGKHISSNMGAPYFYQQYFGHDQIANLKKVYGTFLKELGYYE